MAKLSLEKQAERVQERIESLRGQIKDLQLERRRLNRGIKSLRSLESRVGERHGLWTIVAPVKKRCGRPRVWVLCRGCGKKYIRYWCGIRDGMSTRCQGCSVTAKVKVSPRERFGPFKIVKELRKSKGQRRFKVRCDCGVVQDRRLDHLKTARRTSQQGCNACKAMPSTPERVGETVGAWTIVKDLGMRTRKGKRVHEVRIRCRCGFVKVTHCLAQIRARLDRWPESGCRRCAHDKMLTKDKVCIHCLDPFEDKRSKDTCATCRRRRDRNGTCELCGFPLFKTKAHECKEVG